MWRGMPAPYFALGISLMRRAPTPGRLGDTMRLRVLLAAVCIAALVPATAEASSFSVSPEPGYTKGATNTWHVSQVHSDSDNWFYLCTAAKADGFPIPGEQSNGAVGPSTLNCTGNSGAGTSSLALTLGAATASGHSYELCVSGYVDWPNPLGGVYWRLAGTDCRQTTLDDSKPVLTPSFAAGATRDPRATLNVGYSDSVSPPWAGEGGLLACVTAGETCTPTVAGASACSAPAAAKVTSYACPVTLPADGRWHACVRGADRAVPDMADWSAVTASQANVSDVACTAITLDRNVPPVVTPPVVTPPVVTPPVVTPAATGKIAVRAPKTLKLTRRRARLTLALTADRPGRVSVALLKGARVIVTGAKALRAGTTAYALRLPAGGKLRPGRYVLSVSFTARGAERATTRVAKVRLTR
jgi:hypothetical protein